MVGGLYVSYSARGTRVASKALMIFEVSVTSTGHSIVARDNQPTKQNTNMKFDHLIFEVSLPVKLHLGCDHKLICSTE